MAVLEKSVHDIHAPILQSEAEAALSSGLFEESPALRLVIADTLRAEAAAASRAWVASWPQASILYQSPFEAKYWENTYVPRASIPFYTLATAVNSLIPQIMQGLFYENPPFLIQKRPKTSENAAKAIGAIIGYQLEDEDLEFRREIELGARNALLFGTAIWKWGWEIFTRDEKRYERKNDPLSIPHPLAGIGQDNIEIHDDEDLDEVVEEVYVDRPFFEHIVNCRHVLVDPGLNVPDVRKAKYVVHRIYLTFKELDKLRDRPGYELPPEKELLDLFFPPKEPVESAPGEYAARNPLWDLRAQPRYEDTSEDPFNQPLEILERWDNDTVIVVLQKKLVICNDKNPYGRLPFLSVGWWDIPESFWSLGLAKAQPLDAKVLTPSGWKVMGDIRVGEQVFGSDGKPHVVTGVYPQGEKEVFKVTFTDGSSTECCEEHLWTVETPNSKKSERRGWRRKTYQLQDFRHNLKNTNGGSRFFIPVTQPVDFPLQELPLDPYLLGLLLGDGGLTTETPKFTTADLELAQYVREALPEGMYLVNIPKSKYDYKIISADHKCNKVRRIIRGLGVDCLSLHKFIPDSYKFASVGQRKAILAGLLDSDGTAGNNGAASFSSSSKRLRDDVTFLVQSLGGIANNAVSPTDSGNPSYKAFIGLTFNPFRLTRKKDRYKPRTKYLPTRGFASVESVGVKPCQCIMVDTPDHLYLTDDCVVTHNTIGSEQRLQQGITNTWLDNAALNLNGVYVRTLGKGQQSQSVRVLPGKVINIELDAQGKGDFKPLERLPAVPEASEHLAMSQARVELVSGANEVTAQGVAGNAAHSNLGRSAAGANLIGQGAASRPQDFVEKFVSQVFIPFLYQVHEMNRALLPPETIRHILDEELEHAYFAEGGDIVSLRNARVMFSVLAGAKMQARRQMAQAMPLLVQLLGNEQTTKQLALQGKKVNFVAMFTDLIEVTGWKTRSDWIQDMTPEDTKRYQATTPAAQIQAKVQGQAALQDKAHQQKLEVINDENLARAGREVLRHTMEAAETPEALTGAPQGGMNFGGSF